MNGSTYIKLPSHDWRVQWCAHANSFVMATGSYIYVYTLDLCSRLHRRGAQLACMHLRQNGLRGNKAPTVKFSSLVAQFACWVRNKWRNFQPFPIKASLQNVYHRIFTAERVRCWVFATKQNRFVLGKDKVQKRRKIPFRNFLSPHPSVAPVRRNFRVWFVVAAARPGKFNFLPSKAPSKQPLCFVRPREKQ